MRSFIGCVSILCFLGTLLSDEIVGLDSVLSLRVKSFTVKPRDQIEDVILYLAHVTDHPISLELLPQGRLDGFKEWTHWKDVTINEILDQVVKKFPSYQWRVDREIIRIADRAILPVK